MARGRNSRRSRVGREGVTAPAPAADVAIREATAADSEALTEFHARGYGWCRTASQYLWEFETTAAFVAVAERESRVVGTQALIPAPAIVAGKRVLTAKSEFTLVAPEERGSGLFGRLMDHCFEEADRRSIAGVWGFTSATRAFERVGFAAGPRVARLVLPLRASGAGRDALRRVLAGPDRGKAVRALVHAPQVVARSFRPARGSAATANSASEHLESWAELGRAMLARWPAAFTVERDVDYLRWRVLDNPWGEHVAARSQEGTALAAAMIQGDRAALVDLVTARDDAGTVDAALGAVAAACRARGASLLEAWHIEGHPVHTLTGEALRRRGAVTRGAENAFVWRGEPPLEQLEGGLIAPYLLSEGLGWPR